MQNSNKSKLMNELSYQLCVNLVAEVYSVSSYSLYVYSTFIYGLNDYRNSLAGGLATPTCEFHRRNIPLCMASRESVMNCGGNLS